MATKTICLDAGHFAKYNRSPVNSAYYESDMTWKLHNYLKAELVAKGFKVIVTRTEQDKDLDVFTRGTKAKGCALFLSIHSNAASNADKDNSMACCQINDNTTAIDDISAGLGRKLADAVSKAMGSKSSGTVYRRKGNRGDYYGVLRGAKSVGVPGILLEHGYHTNKNNTAFLLKDANLKTLAKIEADIIADYFGVKAATTTKTTTTSSSLKPPFLVKILDDDLNIRSGVGTSYKIVGEITNHGVYTITEVKYLGKTPWGKLKSGAGWICIATKYVKYV